MIKKLRLKFIAVTMTCISFLLLLILLVINLFMTVSSRKQGYEMLAEFADSRREERTLPFFKEAPPQDPDGSGPSFPPGRGQRMHNYQDAFRIFSVSCDADGTILDVDYNPDSGLEESSILEIGKKALEKNPSHTDAQGIVQSRYLFITRSKDTDWQIYFLDYSVEHTMTFRLFYLCLFAGLGGMVILSAAVFFLSGWMIKPVQDAFDRQKQFIADASHELKTPLTIITTNAEVLSCALGESKWLLHILEQTKRMNALIRELLDLARLDAGQKKPDFMNFDLSRAVSSSALSFESLAFETHKTFQMQVEHGLTLFGSEQAIRQLVTILLDNALKYADEKGTVTLSLLSKGDKKILTVYNTGKGIAPEDQKHIFERFYRSDNSRSRESGGYGLGLAIAASITEQHKGHISVKSDGSSYTRISVSLI